MGFDFLHEEVVTSAILLTLENQKQHIQVSVLFRTETGVAIFRSGGDYFF
jgi:hypothetical protein